MSALSQGLDGRSDMELQWLKAGDLWVDHTYQQPLNLPRVKRIAAEWDDQACGALVVNVRETGEMVIVDGQHRWQAFLIAHGTDQKLPCTVIYGLDVQSEARLFGQLNGPMRRQPKPIVLFHARIVHGEPVAVAIQRVVHACGLTISPSASGHSPIGAIMAVQAMEYIYVRGGESGLRGTLQLIMDTWRNQDRKAYAKDMLLGVFLFLSQYPDADIAHLAEKLAGYTPLWIGQRATGLSRDAISAHGSYGRYAQVLQTIYNTGKRRGKLDDVRQLTSTEMAQRWGMTRS